jgi:tetratricopeptide (TPR) repeat protein
LARHFSLLWIPVFLSLLVGCTTDRASLRSSTPGRAAEVATVARLSAFRLVPPTAVLAMGTASSWADGSSPLPLRSVDVDRAAVDAEIRSLREPVSDRSPSEPLPPEVDRLLEGATAALNAGDHDAAALLAEDAVRRSNGRAEPLEVLLVAQLARGALDAVPAVLREIRRNDPTNPIAIASDGLEAAREGRFEDALRQLCRFIGPDQLPRRGRAIPLPSAPGELAEQAALAALFMERRELALVAVESGLGESRLSPASRSRLELLRIDALAASGRFADARQRIEEIDRVEIARALGPAGPLLVRVRDERLAECIGGTLSDAVTRWREVLRPSGSPSTPLDEDGAFLLALCSLGELARTGEQSVLAELRSLAESAMDGRPSRAAVLAVALDPRFGEACARPPLAKALIADDSALIACMRLLAWNGEARPVSLAASLAEESPRDVDRIVRALLLSGDGIDAILRAIEGDHAGGVGDALRSRILALAGEVERAYAVAATAHSRDRASRAALVAAILAAASLRDETLIDQLELEVRAGGDRLSRTLAAAWLAVGRPDRTVVAAERGLLVEPQDGAMLLLRDVARLDRRDTRGMAIERLMATAREEGATASDARAVLRVRGLAGDTDRARPATIEDSIRLLDESRSPLAVECLALACLFDGAGRTEAELAARVAGPGRARSAERGIANFLTALREECPAVPSRRIAALQVTQRHASDDALPDAPLSARVDARVSADRSVLAQARILASALRPRTPAASAAIAEATLEANDPELAGQALARAASGADGAIPPQAARALLRASTRLFERDPSRSTPSARDLIRFAERVEPAGVADLDAALGFALSARLPIEEVIAVVARIAPGLTESDAADAPALSRMLERLVSVDGDPYLAGRVAAVVAAESRLDPRVRSLLGRSAVALQAAAGVDPADAVRLVRGLAGRGVGIFEPAEGDWTLAEALRRAAGVFAMMGDEGGAERILVDALAEDEDHARALNDLAYLRAERGDLADGTAAMAEIAAAALPDDPSILDTLGFIRYLERRIRDDAGGAGAITLLRQALRLRPEEPSIATLDHLGDALWREGDQSGAVRCWQEVGRVARLRHPPDATRAAIAAFQLREYGVVLADPSEVARRQFGRIVERADRKLRDVAEGRPPAVAELPARNEP